MRRLGLLGSPFPGISDVLAGIRSAWPAPEVPEFLWTETSHHATLEPLVDAWVLLHHEGPEILPKLLSGGRPVVGRSEEYEGRGIPVVRTPDVAAGSLLGQHFAATCPGCLVFVGLTGRSFSDRRARGFRDACTRLGRASAELSDAAWEQVVASLVEAPPGSGFVGWADSAAFRLVREARRAGRQIPEDLSIGGIDNAPLPTDDAPALTTVSLDLHAHGYTLGSVLRDAAAGHPVPLVQDSPVGRLFLRGTAPHSCSTVPPPLSLVQQSPTCSLP